jgi:hypothetical protein
MPTLVLRAGYGRKPSHGFDNDQRSAHCALSIVLMRLRIAEIDERAIAKVSRHVSAEARDQASNALMVVRDDLA